ncbi:MAG: hypothetical protein KAS75_01765 [Planctomycetes bacterium]|nr:hypothetical protein [Planctomycetota bacterium]
MRITYEKGIIRLVVFITVFLASWALMDYYATLVILAIIVTGYAVYYIFDGFFKLDWFKDKSLRK